MTDTARQSLEAAFFDLRQTLVGMLVRLVGCTATAEDLSHEAYLRAVGALRDRPIESPRAFLLRTARNLALDHLRRDKVRRRVFAETATPEVLAMVASPQPTPEADAQGRQRLARLDAALAGVPPRARQVLALSRLQGWTFPEISAYLGVSVTTVQKDLRLALAHCLAALADNDLP